MSNRNVPFFRDYLRVLGAQHSYVAVARAFGNISEDWVYKIIAASKTAAKTPDVPSVFLFEAEEGDDTPLWFHQHVKSVVKNSIEAIEAAARSRALHGTYTVAKFQGKTVYKEDPDLIGLDDETLEMIGLKDRLLRDERGRPLAEKIWTPPSTDLVLGVLAAHARKLYGKNIKMDIDNRISGGVVFAGGPRAPSIAAPLPMVQIVQDAIAEPERPLIDEGDEEEDDTVTDTLPDAPADEIAEPLPIAEPAPMIRASSSYLMDYAPGPNPLVKPGGNRPLTDDERATLARLPSSLNRKA